MTDAKRLGADPLAWIAPEERARDQPGRADAAPVARPGNPLADMEVRREDSQAKAKLEKRLTRDQACATLEALLAGLRGARLDLGREPGAWRLGVGKDLELELKISAKKNRAKCSLELEWTVD